MDKDKLDNFMLKETEDFRDNGSLYRSVGFLELELTKEDVKYLKRAFKFRGYRFKVDLKTKQFKITR
ncbi:hypothetical protein [Staphylococcus phage vB_SurM-PSU4]|nr:hypothetical protein [Staphylococcus phage vB_SurM-PSU4]